MINNVVLVSGVQQRDSVIHIRVSVLFQILFPFRLLQNIQQGSLCYTVGPCWLSIICFLSFSFVSGLKRICLHLRFAEVPFTLGTRSLSAVGPILGIVGCLAGAPGFYTLDSSRIIHSWKPKMFPDIAKYPLGRKSFWVENH